MDKQSEDYQRCNPTEKDVKNNLKIPIDLKKTRANETKWSSC